MKIYIVQTKVFYTDAMRIEHQVADALQPLTVVSNRTKAFITMHSLEKFYKKLGYKRTKKYNEHFPVTHFEMTLNDYRVVIYYLESEVE